MVNNRIRLWAGMTAYDGNPMTPLQGLKHLIWVVKYIRSHPELYRDP